VDAGGGAEAIWTFGEAWDRIPAVHLITSHFTDWATSTHTNIKTEVKEMIYLFFSGQIRDIYWKFLDGLLRKEYKLVESTHKNELVPTLNIDWNIWREIGAMSSLQNFLLCSLSLNQPSEGNPRYVNCVLSIQMTCCRRTTIVIAFFMRFLHKVHKINA